MSESEKGGYRVLARKYRPQKFSELVGQEAMVRTLANAFKHDRLAHAYLLTGVRGVGKTTTARLIARALNCVGPDGRGGPTIDPCGVCEPCRAIAESRHVDVIEMDAASRTGVDDIREIIDSVAYAPAAARYKVYIIDEVHMLSRSAFNALLKTLEEPPAHVKFIFATTEVRKLPVTVLSRCQRFDLPRIGASALIAHLERICQAEGVSAEPGALAAIARAAEGSVRDALSLLDQAIAHGGGETVAQETVRAMLGLADRVAVLDMLRAALAGKAAEALEALDRQHVLGADPAVIFADLLDHVHWLTRIKLAPEAAADPLRGEAERTAAGEMASRLEIGELSRAWQLLLKGAEEIRHAPSPIQAAQMAIVRLAYAARLPDPAEALAMLERNAARNTRTGDDAAARSDTAASPAPAPSPVGDGMAAEPSQDARANAARRASEEAGPPEGPTSYGTLALAAQPANDGEQADGYEPVPADFPGLVQLFHRRRMPVLATHLKDHVRLVDYAPGRLVINPDERLRATFAGEVRRCLESWTGRRWQVAFSDTPGARPLREQEQRAAEARLEAGRRHPVV
ncbi:MAG: DNA polymerase III subunit gamma/tau, partial [Alphaproteobacteria bacterium]